MPFITVRDVIIRRPRANRPDLPAGAWVESPDRQTFPIAPDIMGHVLECTARQLRELLGAGAKIEAGPDGQHYVTAFARPQSAQADGGEGTEEVEGDSFERAMAAAKSDAPAEAAPEAPEKPADPRVKLDRYGVAVAVYHGGLYTHHVNHRGAIEPACFAVTRPSPEFLADVNAALGTGYTLEQFEAFEVA